jgi:hypothetical protein
MSRPEDDTPGRAGSAMRFTREQNQALRLAIRREWWWDGNCTPGNDGNPGGGLDPDAWFPIGIEAPAAEVLAVCAGRSVNRSCLASALLIREVGAWGGTTLDERDQAAHALRSGSSVTAVLDEFLAVAAASVAGSSVPKGGVLKPVEAAEASLQPTEPTPPADQTPEPPADVRAA